MQKLLASSFLWEECSLSGASYSFCLVTANGVGEVVLVRDSFLSGVPFVRVAQLLVLWAVWHKQEALSFDLGLQVQHKHVVKRHMVPITCEDDHFFFKEDAGVTVSWVRPDAEDSLATLLAQRHVQAE